MSDESWRDAENAKAIAAAGKQMDDWAARFGGNVFGAVKISYGENEGHIVKIGEAPSPALEREVTQPLLDKKEADIVFIDALGRGGYCSKQLESPIEVDTSSLLEEGYARYAKSLSDFDRYGEIKSQPWYRKFWNMIRGIR